MIRSLLMAAMLLACAGVVAAQEPVVVTTLPHPQMPDAPAGAPSCAAPGVPACAAHEDCNGRLLVGDPLLEPADAPAPGFYAAFELGILKPHVKFALQAPVDVPVFGRDVVHLPYPALDWTGSPRIELGYRFPEAFGELLLTYRSLNSEGTGTLVNFDGFGPGILTSRLDLHSVDLDYAQREFGLGPSWDMKWRIGVRLASVYFDSKAGGLVGEQRATNHFLGAGPQAGLGLTRELGMGGFSAFGRFEAAALFGRIGQGFEETFAFSNAAFGGATRVSETQVVPVAQAELGLSWVPMKKAPLRFACGYQYEAWWLAGRTSDSRADLWMQGVFLRVEWKY
ncbi:MAG: hypothetical protein K2R98_08295 [Gemmataceae bacterium]|nr:hypothetical protein [Gemmataceae bacterium]